MKEKLLELQELMAQEGCEESVEVATKCVEILKRKQRKAIAHSEKQPLNQEGMNKNENASNVRKQLANKTKLTRPVQNSKSVETIYESAVPKCSSSSSEDEFMLNSSDEIITNTQDKIYPNENFADIDNNFEKRIDNLILGSRRRQAAQNNVMDANENDLDEHGREQYGSESPLGCHTRREIPHGSPCIETSHDDKQLQNKQEVELLTADERVPNMIQQAEAAKARMFATTGNDSSQINKNIISPTAIVDEGYIVVGAHLDEAMVNKIKVGDYVDFGKLIPRDRMIDDDGRMELCIRNGRTFWMLVANTVSINNFSRWEQAFRVYSNIYCKANPHRSAELIEYNHVIHTISLAYTWDNVYGYDKEFRMHMSRNPQRSWAMILQQAWSLRLRDRVHGNQVGQSTSGYSGGQQGASRAKVNEPCRRFNRGRCNFGSNCKYEHRCTYCLKFGHSVLNCRKANHVRSGGKNEGKRDFGSLGAKSPRLSV